MQCVENSSIEGLCNPLAAAWPDWFSGSTLVGALRQIAQGLEAERSEGDGVVDPDRTRLEKVDVVFELRRAEPASQHLTKRRRAHTPEREAAR